MTNKTNIYSFEERNSIHIACIHIQFQSNDIRFTIKSTAEYQTLKYEVCTMYYVFYILLCTLTINSAIQRKTSPLLMLTALFHS